MRDRVDVDEDRGRVLDDVGGGPAATDDRGGGPECTAGNAGGADGTGVPVEDGPGDGAADPEDLWHGLLASTPADSDEPPIEASLAAQLYVEIDIADAAGFKDEPVLAAGIINGLANVDTDALDYRQAVALLDEASRMASAAEALKAKAVSRVCSTAGDRVDEEDYLPPAGPDADQLASMVADSEISTVLDLSTTATHKLINHSQLLTEELPATLDALGRGRLKPQQAEVIVDQCGTLPPEAYAEFEAEMVEFAPGRARHLLADKGRRLRERSHPETIKRRKEKAAADRTVALEPVEDGMCWLSMYLPAEAATAAFNRLTALARSLQGPDEDRPLTQLRADVAADLIHSGTGTGLPPTSLAGSANDFRYGKPNRKSGNDHGKNRGADTEGVPVGPAAAGVAGTTGAVAGGSGRIPNYAGIKAEVFVVVPVLTLMGLSDEPGDLEGYGPIDEETARQLAANAPSFKRLLTHPETGAMLSYGRDTYGVPNDLKRMVQLRDRRCRGHGCNRAARFCEIDHSVPYPAGGTDEWNLKALCKPGHVLKTAGLWRDTQHRNGAVDWTSPAGRKYSNTPDGPLPEMRPVPDIAHLLDLAKDHGKLTAKPTAAPETEGANKPGGQASNDPAAPPPF